MVLGGGYSCGRCRRRNKLTLRSLYKLKDLLMMLLADMVAAALRLLWRTTGYRKMLW